jgi:hypothetical protein
MIILHVWQLLCYVHKVTYYKAHNCSVVGYLPIRDYNQTFQTLPSLPFSLYWEQGQSEHEANYSTPSDVEVWE